MSILLIFLKYSVVVELREKRPFARALYDITQEDLARLPGFQAIKNPLAATGAIIEFIIHNIPSHRFSLTNIAVV